MTTASPAIQAPRPPFPWAQWLNWPVYVAAWSLPGLAALSYYYLNQTVTAQPMDWGYALVSTLPNWYFWAIFAPLILWLADKYRLERGNWKQPLLAIHLPAMLGLMALHALLNLLLFRLTGLHDTLNPTLYQVHFTSRFHANVLTYWTVLGLFYAYDYYQRLLSREQQAAQLQVQLVQANLRALKMQLHPHFLFNTLHSIAALVRKNENRTAIKMLGQLGDFLRLALENKGLQEITLHQELDFLGRYLAIEKVRFQERLAVEMDAADDLQEAVVPNMILQPLVENAIHHGIAPHVQQGRIEIEAHRTDDRLCLMVRDNGPGLKDPERLRMGVGLANTQERLENLYGQNQEFSLRNAASGGLEVRICIPFYLEPKMQEPSPAS